MKFKDEMSFRECITATHARLLNVSDQESTRLLREGGWSRKQILGHLIDSALNNHQRFTRAALEGDYKGPSYQQNGWVAMHGYDSMKWTVLLEHWRWQNELLAEVVERIPEARLTAPCQVGDNPPVTLGFLVEDYLKHLEYHVVQIVG